jgi:hypothetical protein
MLYAALDILERVRRRSEQQALKARPRIVLFRSHALHLGTNVIIKIARFPHYGTIPFHFPNQKGNTARGATTAARAAPYSGATYLAS